MFHFPKPLTMQEYDQNIKGIEGKHEKLKCTNSSEFFRYFSLFGWQDVKRNSLNLV